MPVNKRKGSLLSGLKSIQSFYGRCSLLFVLVSGFAMLFMSSCIESFNPDFEEYDSLLVIDGSIIRGDTVQTIAVSRSTPVYNPENIPLAGCNVSVEDEAGNTFVFEENEYGNYNAAIPETYLEYGAKFRLSVSTPDGKQYESTWQEITESSPIDSIYYIVEEYQSSSALYEKGLQFYADLKAPDNATQYYMWTIEETWEIHTVYDIDGHWQVNDIALPRYAPLDELRLCWASQKIRDGVTESTETLVVNEKKMIPLNFVPDISPKLDFRYSVLVKQFTLNRDAYLYHDQNNFATSGDEGLYQTQPAQSRSNIKNVDNPDEVVLGYFWASSYSARRLFFDGPLTTYHSDCDDLILCIPRIGQTLMQFFQALGRSVYLVAMTFASAPADSVTLWAFPPKQICIDCTAEGGTEERPDFW